MPSSRLFLSRLVGTALLVGTAVCPASAAIIVYEGFDLPGNPATPTNGAGLTSLGWAVGSTWNMVQGNLSYQGTGLVHPALTDGGLSGSGGSVLDPDTTTRGARRTLDTSLFGAMPGAEVWVSFLFQVNTGVNGADLRVYLFNEETSNTGGYGAYITGQATTGFNFRTGVSGGTTYQAGPQAVSNGALDTTFLALLQFQWVDGSNNDILRGWVFAPGDGVPVDPSGLGAGVAPGSAPDVLGAFDLPDPSTISATRRNLLVRGGGNMLGSVDEIRLGTSYADVVGAIPEPSHTAAMLAMLMAISILAAKGCIQRRHFLCAGR